MSYVIEVAVNATLHPEKAMFLRQELGTGETDHGKFDYSVVIGSGAPCIYYRRRYVTIGAESIARIACQMIDAELEK